MKVSKSFLTYQAKEYFGIIAEITFFFLEYLGLLAYFLNI